jgi:hypothetical protein
MTLVEALNEVCEAVQPYRLRIERSTVGGAQWTGDSITENAACPLTPTDIIAEDWKVTLL